jgi:VacB/RNase II family 3'-5' exoribonuclease
MTPPPAQAQELQQLAAAAMRERGLLPDFSPRALQEAEALNRPVIESGDGIRDLTHLPWSSIDNEESRDLDQLEVANKLPGGATQVRVAIADVDCTCRLGSAMDAHARANTTSVYTVARIFPMLPEKLSTDLTSLRQDQTRMSVVFDMTFGADGELQVSDIYRAVVTNRAKLAYPDIAAWLVGGPAPAALTAVSGLDEQVRMQDQVAQSLRRRRQTLGALNFETLQDRPVFDGGLLVDLRPDPKNRAQNLIEDLMIAANSVSARFLAAKGLPALRRVLSAPKRWDRIVLLAREQGDTLPAEPDAVALNAFLARRRQADPARFADLSLSVIKLLGSGEYAVEMPGETGDGHFGLAVRDYTHSTAPNRRFPDLLTQRLLKAALAGHAGPYGIADLHLLATHCTEQEDAAAKVERQVRKSAAAMLLGSRIGESFDGIVTGASDKGTWVRIFKPAAEGRIVRGFEGADVGDHLRVRLLHTDMARGYIDFERA